MCVCAGDAGVSPQESAESSVRSVCGRPEALQLRQSAARPGLSAITQHALQLPRQELAARLTVTLIHTDWVMLSADIWHEACVCREEWAWLQRHAVGGACGSGSREGGDEAVIDSSGVEDFVKALRSAVIQLLTKLNVPLERVTQPSDSSESLFDTLQ